MTNFPGVPWKASSTLTQHVHRVVSRILEANDLGTLRGDWRVPAPPRSMLQSGFRTR